MTVQAVALLLSVTPAYAQTPAIPLNPKPFGLWLQEFEADAVRQGIAQPVLDDAFTNAAPLPRVIELDHKQPESVLTPAQYLAGTVTAKRIALGLRLLAENRALLDPISRQYGVPPEVIVALWGMETGFGANTGGFNVIQSLATLAYDGRRSEYFRGELLKALLIMQSEHLPAAAMKGSWAGAMGQCQFMPSSFLNFAVDYDGDGKRDIWGDRADVFASIANYLASSGWDNSEDIGWRVRLPQSFDVSLADIKQEKTAAQWRKLGVMPHGDFPDNDQPVSLILVGEGEDAIPYLITGNYKVILKWNRSRLFATAITQLSRRIGEGQ